MKYTKDIFEFIKATIEIGGAYVVDEECYIRDSEGELVTLNVNGKPKALMIFNENMRQGEHCIVNPLVETIASSAERNWYFTTLSRICGGLIHTLIDSVITKVIAEKEGNGDGSLSHLEILGPIAKIVDKKLLKESDKLHSNNILRIYYSANEHVAQAQTDLDDLSYMEELDIRKRSFAAFQGMLSVFLDTKIEDVSTKFMYKSKHFGFGKVDALLNLYVMVLDAISPYVSELLVEARHYDLSRIIPHLDNLKEYSKDCRWFAGGISPSSETSSEPEELPPWQTQQTQSWQQPVQPQQQPSMQQQQQQPFQQQQSGHMIPMAITGMVQPKPYGQQTMQYPGFGNTIFQQPQQQPMQGYYPQQQAVVSPHMTQQQPIQGYYPQQQQVMVQQPNHGQRPMMQQYQPIDISPMTPGGSNVEYNTKSSTKIQYK